MIVRRNQLSGLRAWLPDSSQAREVREILEDRYETDDTYRIFCAFGLGLFDPDPELKALTARLYEEIKNSS